MRLFGDALDLLSFTRDYNYPNKYIKECFSTNILCPSGVPQESFSFQGQSRWFL